MGDSQAGFLGGSMKPVLTLAFRKGEGKGGRGGGAWGISVSGATHASVVGAAHD